MLLEAGNKKESSESKLFPVAASIDKRTSFVGALDRLD